MLSQSVISHIVAQLSGCWQGETMHVLFFVHAPLRSLVMVLVEEIHNVLGGISSDRDHERA